MVENLISMCIYSHANIETVLSPKDLRRAYLVRRPGAIARAKLCIPFGEFNFRKPEYRYRLVDETKISRLTAMAGSILPCLKKLNGINNGTGKSGIFIGLAVGLTATAQILRP